MRKVKASRVLLFAAACILTVIYIFPFVLTIFNSMKTSQEFIMNPFSLPSAFHVENFTQALQEMKFFSALKNTFILTIVSSLLITLFGATAAYVVSRFSHKKWVSALFLMMVASMVAPFQVYMIPIVKIYGGTFGLNNSLLFLSVVALGLNLPFSIFLIRGFLNGIPIEIEQAAMIDGCSYIQVFFRIVLPMLKPIVITLLVFVSMGIWNDYLMSSLFLTDEVKRTLALPIRVFVNEYSVDYAPMLAGLFLSMIPMLIFYVLCQKHILEGVVQGSVKG